MPTLPAPSAPIIAVAGDPAGDPDLQQRARHLACELEIPQADPRSPTAIEFLLVVTPQRLELRVTGGDMTLRGGRPLYVDALRRDITSHAGGRLDQPLLRAVGVRQRKQLDTDVPRIVDATAGWGGDALMLASLGCSVLAVERHRVIAELLRDGVNRASAALGHRITIASHDASDLLQHLHAAGHDATTTLPAAWQTFVHPDVIYLDPMFPPRRGRAAESKSMRVLRRLAGSDEGGATLLTLAQRVGPPRIVVKRPLRAEALGYTSPDATYRGKAMRYDVYFQAAAR